MIFQTKIKFPEISEISNFSGFREFVAKSIFLKKIAFFGFENRNLNFRDAEPESDVRIVKRVRFLLQRHICTIFGCMQNPIFAKFYISLNLKNYALFRIIFIDFLSNFLQRDIWKIISNS